MDTPKKLCPMCGQELDLAPEFWHRDNSAKDGFRGRCKSCENAIKRGELYLLKSQLGKYGNADDRRRCFICQGWFPATDEYFHRKKAGKYGLLSRCRTCASLIRRGLLCPIDPYKCESGFKRCAKCAKCKPANRNYFDGDNRKSDSLEATCIICTRLTTRILRALNPEKRHKEGKLYREKYPNRVNAVRKSWKKRNPHKNSLYVHRRLARKHSLPDTFSEDDYQRMMEYWGGKCALSGEAGKITLDHWIPLSDPACPGTTATNILPMLSTLNYSKNAQNPQVWLRRKFGTEKAQEILRRIEHYFEWIKEQGS